MSQLNQASDETTEAWQNLAARNATGTLYFLVDTGSAMQIWADSLEKTQKLAIGSQAFDSVHCYTFDGSARTGSFCVQDHSTLLGLANALR